MFIPVNTGARAGKGQHWKFLLLQVASDGDNAGGTIWDADSCGSTTNRALHRKLATDVYQHLLPDGPALQPGNAKYSPKQLPAVLWMVNRQRQTNGYDCGLFVLGGIESLAIRGTMDFDQDSMIHLRAQLLLQCATSCSVPKVRPVRSPLAHTHTPVCAYQLGPP